MSVPSDNFADLIDHLYDARTLGIDTVEWLDQHYKTSFLCACVTVVIALIDRVLAEANAVADKLGPIP